MAGRLSLPHLDDTVGTEVHAETALNADHGFIDLTVPVDGPHYARLGAAAAPGAFLLGKVYSPLFSAGEGVHGAGPDTRRVLADPAGYHDEPVFHPAAGPDPDTRLRQAVAVRSPRAREHAALTPDTPFHINHRQSFHLQAPPGGPFLYSILLKSGFGRELAMK